MGDTVAFWAWYGVLGLLSLAGLPLTHRLFHTLPDRGITFARPVGLLAAGYLYWVLGTLGLLPTNAVGAGLAVSLVALAGLALIGAKGWAVLWRDLRSQRLALLVGEVLFLGAFAGWTWVRAHNPDIVATEKPMEYMLLNSVLSSSSFPPHDAWLSGFSISYDYFGYILVALVTRLAGTAAAVSYNLALSAWFALVVSGAYALVFNVAQLLPEPRAPGRPGRARRRPRSQVRAALWPACLAPVVVILAGNLYGVLRLLHSNGVLADAVIVAPYSTSGLPTAEPGIRVGPISVWSWLDTQGITGPPTASGGTGGFNFDPGHWWWFEAARIVNDRNLSGLQSDGNAITEFPAFSFILGDLQPHVLALPFVFLALAVALMWFLWGQAADLVRPPVTSFSGSALILGALGLLDTWDLQIYGAVVVAAVLAGWVTRAGGWRVRQGWRRPLVNIGGLAALSLAVYMPFRLAFRSQPGELLPNVIYPTRLQQIVVMFGPVLALALLTLAVVVWRTRRRFAWRVASAVTGWGIVALIGLALALGAAAWADPAQRAAVFGTADPTLSGTAAGLILSRRLLDSWATLLPALMIGVVVAAILRMGPETGDSVEPEPGSRLPPVLAFCGVLLAVGALLILGPEWVYLRDTFSTRMNTVFKLYYQAWILWGIGGWVGFWWLVRTAGPRLRVIGIGLVALIAGGGLVYTGLAVASTTRTDSPALDGMAYFARAYPDDWAAAVWLKAHAAPDDVIVEAVSGQSWTDGIFSRLSMATGLQTILGWPGHERQWRGAALDPVLSAREADVRQLYTTRDVDLFERLLAQYDVRYVVLGRVEQVKYEVLPGTSLVAKFEQVLTPVFESGMLTLYERVP